MPRVPSCTLLVKQMYAPTVWSFRGCVAYSPLCRWVSSNVELGVDVNGRKSLVTGKGTGGDETGALM
jgi:hypothetical protein